MRAVDFDAIALSGRALRSSRRALCSSRKRGPAGLRPRGLHGPYDKNCRHQVPGSLEIIAVPHACRDSTLKT